MTKFVHSLLELNRGQENLAFLKHIISQNFTVQKSILNIFPEKRN